MAFSSAQISQMIGAQQVMFSNQAQFAHQIGSQAGTMPPGMGFGGGMQAPTFANPGWGQQPGFASAGGFGGAAVGAMGGAIPGAATGAMLAGGFLGGAAGYMDPFTGTARAFASGAGFGGQGFMGTMRGIGGLGLRGGAAAVGGGLAAAALPAAAYYAAYKGVEHVGGQIYQGAQNIGQVGQIAQQHFGPVWGETGQRQGGQMARQQIQQITSVLHEIAGQETMASLESLKRMMDRAGQMGMLQGITTAGQFETKFKKVVGQVKQVAKIMGTSLEEAMPMLQGFQQMGLWRTSDIMGAAMATQTVGAGAAPALMGTMQAGAQRSHAMGGSLAAGANLGRNQFMNVQAAMREGLLTGEQLAEYTGGIGGAEGQRIAATRLTGMMQNISMTPIGRLGMAALGEQRNGRFTGRVDQRLMQDFMSGNISVGELQSMGQRRTGSREAAASFTNRQEQIGQQLMSEGGMELSAKFLQAGLQRAGFGGASEDIQSLMMQKMFGLSRRDAHLMQQMMKDLPAISERRERQEMAALEDVFRKAEDRQNHSWAGFKEAMAHHWEEAAERPLQEFAERLTTRSNEIFERGMDSITGRARNIRVTRDERIRSLYRGGGLSGVGAGGEGLMQRGFQEGLQTGAIERYRRQGLGGILDPGGGKAGDLRYLGGQTRQVGIMEAMTGGIGAGDIVVGGPENILGRVGVGGTMGALQVGAELLTGGLTVMSSDQAQAGLERARLRQSTGDMNAFFNRDSVAKNAEDLETVRGAYNKLRYNLESSSKLREAKKTMRPAEYGRYVESLLKQDPAAAKALRSLASRSTASKGDIGSIATQDALRVIQEEDGKNNLNVEFEKYGVSINELIDDPAKLRAHRDAGVAEAFAGVKSASSGVSTVIGGTLGGALGAVFGGVGVAVGGGIGAAIGELFEGEVSEQEIEDVFLGEVGEELQLYLSGQIDEQKFKEQAPRLWEAVHGENRDERVTKILDAAAKDPKIRARIAKGGGMIMQAKGAKISDQVIKERARLATRERSRAFELGLQPARRDEYVEVLEMYKSGDREKNEEAAIKVRKLAEQLTPAESKKLMRAGGVGAMVSGLAELGRLEERVTGKGYNQVLNQLGEAGLRDDLERLKMVDKDFAQEFEAMFKEGTEGGAGLGEGEFRKLKTRMQNVVERLGPQAQGGRGRRDVQAEMLEKLTAYTDANARFVLAVKEANASLGSSILNDLLKKGKEMKETATNATPGTATPN